MSPARQVESGISRSDANRLIRATGGDLLDLFREASAIRDASTGPVITYSRKVFIPLTNLCRDRCGYCTFAREPGDAKAHTMTPDEVLAVARAGREAGCKEALFSLGDKPELRYPEYRDWLDRRGFHSTIGYLRAMCQLVFQETGLLPHANPGAPGFAAPAAFRCNARRPTRLCGSSNTSQSSLKRPGTRINSARTPL